jgi:hypothetical protein
MTIGVTAHIAIAAQISIALGFIVDAKNIVPGTTAIKIPTLDISRLLIAKLAIARSAAQIVLVISRATRADMSCGPSNVPTPEKMNGKTGYLPMFVQVGTSFAGASSIAMS